MEFENPVFFFITDINGMKIFSHTFQDSPAFAADRIAFLLSGLLEVFDQPFTDAGLPLGEGRGGHQLLGDDYSYVFQPETPFLFIYGYTGETELAYQKVLAVISTLKDDEPLWERMLEFASDSFRQRLTEDDEKKIQQLLTCFIQIKKISEKNFIQEIAKKFKEQQFPRSVLPNGVRVLDYSDLYNQGYFFKLPVPIERDLSPANWITDFTSQFQEMLKENIEDTFSEKNYWFLERLNMLAYGIRGLNQYRLIDATIAVPPLKSTFDPLIDLLMKGTGKVGLFAPTGFGKSRLILYLTHWWLKNYVYSKVLIIDHPRNLIEDDWKKILNVLEENPPEKEQKRWLLIIEDTHTLTETENNFQYIVSLVTGSRLNTYSLLLAFTKGILEKEDERTILRRFKEVLDPPPKYRKDIDLKRVWPEYSPYVLVWVLWVGSERILKRKIPLEKIRRIRLEKYQSPWALVVALGFLEETLEEFLIEEEALPSILYGLVAFLYLLTHETGIPQSVFLNLLRKTIGTDSQNDNWEAEIINMLKDWCHPDKRLLPEMNEQFVLGTISRFEPVIEFYHWQWAETVWQKFQEFADKDYYEAIERILQKAFPYFFGFWRINLKSSLSYLDSLKKNTDLVIKNGNLQLKSIEVRWLDLEEGDLTPLKGFIELQNLRLDYNQIKKVDLTLLEGCSNLQGLSLGNNRLQEINLKPLRSCNQLKTLILNSNYLKEVDLTPLEECSNLQGLNLGANRLQEINLKPLKDCNRLIYLVLAFNPLKEVDLTPLTNCNLFESIALVKNQLKEVDLTPLTNCTQLKNLMLNKNQLREVDLTPLKNCNLLKSLWLDDNQLKEIDLTPLTNCTQLKDLRLDGNHLTRVDLEPLVECIYLDNFKIDHTVEVFLSQDYQNQPLPLALRSLRWDRIKWY